MEWLVIIWLFAGALTMINMKNTDSWNLKFNYILTWIVLMIFLIDRYWIA